MGVNFLRAPEDGERDERGEHVLLVGSPLPTPDERLARRRSRAGRARPLTAPASSWAVFGLPHAHRKRPTRRPNKLLESATHGLLSQHTQMINETDLASLLLGRLPSPVVRLDFRRLQRCCSSAAADESTAEAALVSPFRKRRAGSVREVLDQLHLAARAALDADDKAPGLSKSAFVAFHGLLSRTLLQRVDEHSPR